MASLPERAKAIAQVLITTAGMGTAVAAADINRQAEVLQKQYAQYSLVDIKNKISDEIKKTHRPGISGSL